MLGEKVARNFFTMHQGANIEKVTRICCWLLLQ